MFLLNHPLLLRKGSAHQVDRKGVHLSLVLIHPLGILVQLLCCFMALNSSGGKLIVQAIAFVVSLSDPRLNFFLVNINSLDVLR